MQESVLEINGIKTPILTFGKTIEEQASEAQKNGNKEVILLIPGNPGITSFYRMFCLTLHQKTNLPVWVVGHAGHEISRFIKNKDILYLKGNEEIFGLKEQITHKIDFIKRFIPDDVKLHLIGHSIGCYIILELLKHELISNKVIDVKLLFPTIEYMLETPNGKFMTKFIKPIVWFIVFLSWIYTILPSFLSHFLMYIYMKIAGLPQMHFNTLHRFIHPRILEKVFFMAFEELDQVRERDNRTLKNNLAKIRIIYGENDGWAPGNYCRKLLNDIPDVRAEVSNYDHAFVLKQSREVGNLVADWIKHDS